MVWAPQGTDRSDRASNSEMKKPLSPIASLVVACGFFATGCLSDGAVSDPTIVEAPGPGPAPAPSIGVPAGMDLVAGVTERNTSPDANGEAVNAVVSGTNELAVRLFQAAIGEPSGNAVIGNHSVSNALFLTMAGTAGDTTDGFADLLGVADVDRTELHPAVNATDLILESRSGDGLSLAIANKLFVQNGLELRDEFLDIAVGSYGAPVAAVD